RFIYLRLILKANLFPELFLMPRGLVTILLFYSIPVEKQLSNFKVGILFYIIVLTSLLMMVGLMFFKKEKSEYLQSAEDSPIRSEERRVGKECHCREDAYASQ